MFNTRSAAYTHQVHILIRSAVYTEPLNCRISVPNTILAFANIGTNISIANANIIFGTEIRQFSCSVYAADLILNISYTAQL